MILIPKPRADRRFDIRNRFVLIHSVRLDCNATSPTRT